MRNKTTIIVAAIAVVFLSGLLAARCIAATSRVHYKNDAAIRAAILAAIRAAVEDPDGSASDTIALMGVRE